VTARRPVIAFQGERGAFSQEATRRLCGPDVDVLPCPRFEDLFLCVKDGRAPALSCRSKHARRQRPRKL
jgi:prephenate dehydratase